MVLPSPAADAGAARAPDWLSKLLRQLEHARRGILFALTGATPTQLGPVVRALSKAPPWSDEEGVLEVCLRADELLSVAPGSRVLLRVVVEDLEWLNLNRPIFADRRLRAVLWVDEAALDGLVRQAVDLFDWVSLVVPVPAKPLPDFAVARVRAAIERGDAFVWTEGPLAEAWPPGLQHCVLVNADSFEMLLATLAAPGLPLVPGLRSEHDVWRVRMALALAGRDGSWVALAPESPLPMLPQLSAEQADWDDATAQLRAGGYPRPALLAAWFDLDPDRLRWLGEQYRPNPCERDPTQTSETGESSPALTQLVDSLRTLGANTPSVELIDLASSEGFDDVAAALAQIRADHSYDERTAWLVQWLSSHGKPDRACAVARRWVARSDSSSDIESRAAARLRLGMLLESLGQVREAQDVLAQALPVQRALVAHEPNRAVLQRQLALTLDTLARVDSAFGRQHEARTRIEEAVEVAGHAVRLEPDELDHSAALAIALAQLGESHLHEGSLSTAIAKLEASLEVSRAMCARAPDDLEAQQLLCNVLTRFGRTLTAAGETGAAHGYLEQSVELARALLDRDPSRRDFQRALLVSACALASVEREPGSVLRLVEEGVRLAELRSRDEPSGMLELAYGLSVLGELHRRLGNTEAARSTHESSVALLTELLEHEPERFDIRHDLAVREMQLALADNSGDERARRTMERAIERFQELLAREPANAVIEHELAAARASLGAWTGDRELLRTVHEWLSEQQAHGTLLPRLRDLADVLAREFAGGS